MAGKKQEMIDRGDFVEDELDEMEEEREADVGDADTDEDIEEEEVEEEEEDEGTEDESTDEDEEDGSDDEGLEEDEEESDEGATGKRKDVRIPKSRFDEVIAQREELRESNANLSKQVEQLMDLVKGTLKKEEPAPKKEEFVYDFDAREEEYMEAVLSGDNKQAAAIRKEIRAAEKKMLQLEQQSMVEEARNVSKNEVSAYSEELRFDKAVAANEEKYSFLNSNDKANFNPEAVDKVNAIFAKLLKAGEKKADAINEAVALVAPQYTKKVAPKGKSLGGKRDVKALKKNAQANNAQPPKMKGKTTKSKAIEDYDVTKMTDSEFNKLPADVKRKLRGD